MLNKDQRERLSLLRSMSEKSRKECLESLEANDWDTAMALEWMKKKEEDPNASIEEFHAQYEQARDKAFVLPDDRYDVDSKKQAAPNRAARRAEKKKQKNKKPK